MSAPSSRSPGIITLALTLALFIFGCTGSADPLPANDGSMPPAGSNGSGAVDDPGHVYPDPLSDDEVVNGRRVKAGAFPAIWPEASLADVALVQLATLDGHETWRLTPAETAERFAVEILGWSSADVRSSVRAPKHPWWPMSEVKIRSANEADGGPIVLSMRAFGPWGSGYRWRSAEPGTVWSVERVDTRLLVLDALFDEANPTMLMLAGAVNASDPSRVEVSIDLFDGQLGGSARPFPGGDTHQDEGVFQTRGVVGSPWGGYPAALAVTLTDRTSGDLLGLDALPLGPPTSRGAVVHRRIWPVASDWYVGRPIAKASPFGSSRRSSTGTAERFAVEVLGWDTDDVESHVVDGWDGTVVAVWNERVREEGGQPLLTLVAVRPEEICTSSDEPHPIHCRGFTPTGYWTVASADSALAELDPAQARFDEDLLRVPVSTVGGLGSRHLELELSDGAAGTSGAPWLRLMRSRTDAARSLSAWSIDRGGWVTALAYVVDDATGMRVAVDAFPIWIPRGGSGA